MKKIWKDNPYFKIAVYALAVAILTILFYRLSSNSDNIMPSIMGFFKGIINILLPILYGFLIAYLFNPIMMFFEKYYMKWFKPHPDNPKALSTVRSLSILSVYVVIGGTLALLIKFVIPQIYSNIKDLANALPSYMDLLNSKLSEAEVFIDENFSDYITTKDIASMFDMFDPHKILNFDLFNNIFSTVKNHAVSIFGALYNIIMGLVIAWYMLAQKDSFTLGTKKIVYVLFSKERANKIISVAAEGHQIFVNFFIGKFIDSAIIGVIAFIGFSIMKNPYALLLAIVVGIFNMIPYFGPILGAIPAVGITLFIGFKPAMAVLIFIVVLQQFDGLVLGPKILGDSIGLSPFWIISGIIVGGALWGPLGMFFASPIVALILTVTNRSLNRHLEQKGIAPDSIQTSRNYDGLHLAKGTPNEKGTKHK